ncbi:hypothetical protein [Streptomyces hesseae]|uniref:Secreted protein n=1 Tax=Streptomyces hesseae TaxID=3075519 RepID=A0ABU2SW87_9ACTN|nr:hypothetical protein [Streptomyces sp. DSM 40473]MDT0453236.1 hypothetical protein [Streptomyces sp. DSM 40473]
MSETAVIRGLAVAAAAVTVVGSVMMRRWDRAAGRSVAQLTAARTREEWKTEERVAELETDLEETRLLRTGLESKLRAKRAELARLRTEHADLLRRYAAAETGRASAMEGRRLLEKGTTPAETPATDKPAPLNAEAYRKAANALQSLARGPVVGNRPAGRDGWAQPDHRPALEKAPQSAKAPVAAKAAQPAKAPTPAAAQASPAAQPTNAPKATGQAQAPQAPQAAKQPAAANAPKPAGQAPAPQAAARPAAAKATPPAKARPSRPAGTVVPAARRQPGGFDFFGTAAGKKKADSPAAKAVEEQDLADVIGEEALADAAVAEKGVEKGVEKDADGKVIDLTAHDDTEQIDVVELRSAIS